MAKIIGFDPGAQKKVTHKDCGAKLSYYQNEVQSAIHEDYGGGSEEWYFIIFPNCGKKVKVKG